jgi:hypothetical protein
MKRRKVSMLLLLRGEVSFASLVAGFSEWLRTVLKALGHKDTIWTFLLPRICVSSPYAPFN